MDAVDDLSDAIDATRNFLTPVQAGTWLRLALVVFFVGGTSSGFSSTPTGDVGPVEEQTPEVGPGEIPEEVLIGAVVVVGILLLIWAAFAAVAAIMEFVFIESLRSSEVHVRRYSNENVGRGLRLFGFRVGLGLVALVVGAAPLVAAFALDGSGGPFFAAVLFAIGVYLAYAVVGRFTSEFVAPIMLLEARGVLSAWRRFWPTLGSNGLEYAVYLLLVWIIQLVVNIAALIVMVIVAIVVAIPFVILAVVFAMFGDIGLLLAGITAIAGVIAVALGVLFVRVPVASYFKYYALLLLGDTDSELDLIPEQRAAIRTDGGEGALENDREETDSWDADEDREFGDRETGSDDEPADDDWTTDYGWDDDEDEMDDWDDTDWGERDEDDRDEDDDRGW